MSLTFTTDSRCLLFTWGGPPINKVGAALLDLSTGKERVRFTGHTSTVLCGALSPDGTLAATAGGKDCVIHLWKTSDATPVHRLAGKGLTNWSAAWSPDGRTIAWGNTRAHNSLKAADPLERAFHLSDLEFADAPGTTFRRAQLTRGSLALESSGTTTVAVKRGNSEVATLKMTDPYD